MMQHVSGDKKDRAQGEVHIPTLFFFSSRHISTLERANSLCVHARGSLIIRLLVLAAERHIERAWVHRRYGLQILSDSQF